MSYANLVALSCANRAEVFKRFRDFVCKRNGSYDYSTDGIGWTLHDAVYATDEDTIATNDYFVIYSAGESGTEDLYFKCTYKANYILIQGYLYWNNSTHAGVTAYNASDNWNIPDAAVPVLWVYGDLDQVLGISRETSVSTNFYPVVFGVAVETMYDRETVTCAGALSSGADQVIDVGTVPSHWWVGQKIFIRDTANIAVITISAKTASTITATLATNYLAGAKLAADVVYFCPSANNMASTLYRLIDHAGVKSGLGPAWVANTGLASSGYPEVLNSEHILTEFYSASAAQGYLGQLKNVFLRHTSGITALDVHQLRSGLNGRAFTLYNSMPVWVKEV